MRRRGRGALELPLLDLGRGGRVAAGGEAAARRHPRLGPEPDRAGHRVRLLLRPRGADLPRARLRDRDGQLQSRDGLDRLRHVRPPLLRAARASRRCSRSARASGRTASSSSSAARRRSSWRARSRTAGVPILGTPFDAVDLAEDRERFAELCGRARARRARLGHGRRRRPRRWRSPRRSATRCSFGRRTCSAAGAMRVCYEAEDVRGRCARGAGRVLVDRFLEGAVELDVDALCDGEDTLRGRASCSTSRRPASTRATPPACCRRSAAPSPSSRDARRRSRAARARARRRRAHQRPAGARRTAASSSSRRTRARPARFRSSRKAIGVNLVAGRVPTRRRRQARRGPRRPPGAAGPRLREGGRLPVHPLPRRRPGARAGDALDRRGHGERGRLPDGVRQGRAGGTQSAHEHTTIRPITSG